MSKRYDDAYESLNYDPEPLAIDKTQIMRDAYEGLCWLVENEEITNDEANDLYNLLRQQWGMD